MRIRPVTLRLLIAAFAAALPLSALAAEKAPAAKGASDALHREVIVGGSDAAESVSIRQILAGGRPARPSGAWTRRSDPGRVSGQVAGTSPAHRRRSA